MLLLRKRQIAPLKFHKENANLIIIIILIQVFHIKKHISKPIILSLFFYVTIRKMVTASQSSQFKNGLRNEKVRFLIKQYFNQNNKQLIKRMEYYQKKEQDYTKWDESIWLSVQKQISQFQAKVTTCMLQLGSLNKTKVEDFKVEPLLDDDVILGEEFYQEIIRPICVTKKYLPKKIPSPEDLKDSDDSQQEQIKMTETKSHIKQKKEEKEKKKGGKKGGKNNQGKNENEVKLKIIKQNLKKDIDLVLNSHSMDRMQFEFGLKNKKLELRLITFFYIAYFISKNKQKLKIDDSEIFELINILAKIIRIFDKFQGKSFFVRQKQRELEQISPTLLLDMKLLVKELKQIYKYSNKKIIINYPKLVYYTNYDRFFPTLDIKPYPSQIDFIQAVKAAFNPQKGTIAKPTLILYRTMIGSGKTSASLSLSNLINETKILDQKNANYQIVYSCVIGSVRVQVGRYAYNNKQKFALAAMERSIKDEDYYYPRVINSYSCKNEKVVDLIISDLDCTYSMLGNHHYTQKQLQIHQHENKNRKNKVNIGLLEKQNVVLFIDQPTAFCKDVNSPTTLKLFNILANYPPKVIILASATMPPKEQLKNTITLIEQRNPGLQVFQVDSKEFQIGCQYSSFKGEIIFPHTGVKNKQELLRIITLVQKNPFLLRLYTGPSLYFLLRKCQSCDIEKLPNIESLAQIRQEHISKLTMRILKALLKQQDETIEKVCRLSADEANIDYKVADERQSDPDDDIFGNNEEQEKQNIMKEQKLPEAKGDYVNFKNMLRKDSHKFLGGCLIATSNPLEFAHTHFEKWMIIDRKKKESIKPIRRLLEKYNKQVEALQKEIKNLEDDDRRDDTITKEITKIQDQKQPKIDFPDYKRINTVDHYNRYCEDKQNVHTSMLIKPMPIELVAEQLVDEVQDFVLKLLCCGVALYMEKGLSPKYLDKVEELASQNYLAFIITDQSLCYGTNFPISNVILCDDLAEKLNMNQMFQLIGRAGRVGQSWTARAFLQERGLKLLSQYIHSEDQKMSQQAQIFEKVAFEYLESPQLSLRTAKSEIKYANIENPDDKIQLIIKKKNKQDYHIFRKVVLVPFSKEHRILTFKHPHESINYYQLAQSDILYEDLPTKLNSKQEPIIDVEAYYKNEQQFIRQTLNKAVARILKTTLEGKISNQGQVNQFKPKQYEAFFCTETKTFVVLIKCNEEIEIGNFVFNKLKSNSLEKLEDNIIMKLQKYIEQCQKFSKILFQNPQSIFQNDVKEVKAIHEDLMGRQRTKFYSQIYNFRKNEIQKQYEALISHIDDKKSLQGTSESKIIMFVQKYSDFKNVEDKMFHIDLNARKIWSNVMNAIQK